MCDESDDLTQQLLYKGIPWMQSIISNCENQMMCFEN